MLYIIANIFKGGGNSLKFGVGSCKFLSGGRVSSRAVGGSSSSGRFGCWGLARDRKSVV